MFLSNALKLKSRVLSSFALTDITSLKAWYKYNTNITVDGSGNVSRWADSSGNTSEDMDVTPPAVDNTSAYESSTGAVVFTTVNKSYLSTASASNDQLNLGVFTAMVVMDFDETVTLSNDTVIGRLANDTIRYFRGASTIRVGFRANGVISDMNNVTGGIPTGKFLMTMIRFSNGNIVLRHNQSQVESTTSSITDLFDFTGFAQGTLDAKIYECAIFNAALTGSDLTDAENDIKNRNGI